MAKPYSPTSLNGHTMHILLVQHEAAKQHRLFIEELVKTGTPEQIKRFCLENGFAVPEPTKKPQPELWDADPNCDHDEQPASGGGVRCTKCKGWFCY